MKPREQAKRRILAEWLRKADADMNLAEHLVSEGVNFPSAITFHCQQAVEKYLKALLTWWDIEFPKTHVLAKLIGLVETRDATLATSLLDAVVLRPTVWNCDIPAIVPTPRRTRLAKRLTWPERFAMPCCRCCRPMPAARSNKRALDRWERCRNGKSIRASATDLHPPICQRRWQGPILL